MTLFSPIAHGYWRLLDWHLRPNEIQNLILKGLDLGISTLDHADIYGDYQGEAAFGQGFKRLPPSTRSQVQLVTKCGIHLISSSAPARKVKHYDYRAAHIIQSVDNSLERLGTDYLDALLLHRPSPLLQPQEVAEAFEQLYQAGKVRGFGLSNFSPSQWDVVQRYWHQPLWTQQVEISPLQTDYLFNGGQDHALAHAYSPMAWSPLGGGRLFQPKTPQEQRVFGAFQTLSQECGIPIDTLAYAWLRALPSKPIILVGSGKVERLKAATEALSFTFPYEAWFHILEASRGHAVA
ncbi:MAG: hypothetical protein ABR98_06680 [Cryomorphaceae bacterium BACL7 MAG-120910-bin2]|jgi:predicted oxidoreductase|nr:MAG: hypothetical protein ABR98_06680 [Cryomorphaceae bacterium BACL7 MAG-120910-bin2]KRO69416.1 MAG: hypothetical protein ABR88_05435 [Cryomorphaceae bacterium BACL7 MAG-120322-bin74]KRO82998.1 MAG: hypothetical protein ABR87_04270 [Cryomorphaceae bacterium BACL7 MAG-121220-bin83]